MSDTIAAAVQAAVVVALGTVAWAQTRRRR